MKILSKDQACLTTTSRTSQTATFRSDTHSLHKFFFLFFGLRFQVGPQLLEESGRTGHTFSWTPCSDRD